MGMLDRYKKRGGFVQLVQLIETTGGPKRDNFLRIIAEESPSWEAAIKQKIISIDRMVNWPAPYLMEVFPTIPPMALACGIFPLPEDKRKILLAGLSHGERRKVDEILAEHKPSSGEIASSQMKIIGEVRKLASSGRLKFDKFDPDLCIAEDIEEELKGEAYGGGSRSSAPSEPAPSSGPPSRVAEILAAAGGSGGGGGGGGGGGEEVISLRKKMVVFTQDIARLQKENKELRDKMDLIKSVVNKAS